MKVVILAGGLGSRISEFTHKVPKPMINIGMADKIEGYLNNKGTYFVIVGALHIGGEQGLLDLLSKKGFKIEQAK